jgi:hypothetical protein
MSAFLVSKKHVDTLVSAAIKFGMSGMASLPNSLGQTLWDENVKSVNAGIGPKANKRTYEFTAVEVPSPVAVMKAVQCYQYQASDHAGWEGSAAAEFCDLLIHAAIRSSAGYEDAEWAI